MKRFLEDPDRGRPRQPTFASTLEESLDSDTVSDDELSDTHGGPHRLRDLRISGGRLGEERTTGGPKKLVDVVLSDMSAPWEQTTGFWKRSLSNPYLRMMNTSGIPFKDHAGSMVR